MKALYPGLTLGKATRDAYGETLRELGREHKDIVVLDAVFSGGLPFFSYSSSISPCPVPYTVSQRLRKSGSSHSARSHCTLLPSGLHSR